MLASRMSTMTMIGKRRMGTFQRGSAGTTPLPYETTTTTTGSSSTSSSPRTFREVLTDWQRRHRAFVKRVHAFRIPLSPTGRRIASAVYFTVPIVAGYYIMQWAEDRAKENMGDITTSTTTTNGSSKSSGGGSQGGGGEESKRAVLEARQTDHQIAMQNERLHAYLGTFAKKGGEKQCRVVIAPNKSDL